MSCRYPWERSILNCQCLNVNFSSSQLRNIIFNGINERFKKDPFVNNWGESFKQSKKTLNMWFVEPVQIVSIKKVQLSICFINRRRISFWQNFIYNVYFELFKRALIIFAVLNQKKKCVGLAERYLLSYFMTSLRWNIEECCLLYTVNGKLYTMS